MKMCHEEVRSKAGFLVVAAVILTCFSLGAADDYANWRSSQRILFNTTSSGANVGTNQANFPVLIRLDPSNFPYFDQTAVRGADVRFSRADGTHIPYQIERWVDHDVTTGNDNDSAVIWVKVDITGNSNVQYIVMYWNPSIPVADSSNALAVFNPANGFYSVYHLANDPGPGIAGDIKDATGAWNMTANGQMTPASLVTGMIGPAINFNGSTDWLKTVSNLWTPPSTATVSFWFRATGIPDPWQTFFARGNTWECFLSTNGKMTWDMNLGGEKITSVTTSTNGVWYYASFSYTTSGWKCYLNGSVDGSGTPGFSSVGADTLYLGCRWGGGAMYRSPIKGIIDEFRVDKVQRSDSWIKLCYENQRPQATQKFISFCAPPAITAQPQNSLSAVGSAASFSVSATGTGLAYKWQRSLNSGTDWSDVPGATSATWNFTVTAADIGATVLFRCFIDGTCGTDLTSASVRVLSSCTPPSIQSVALLDSLVAVGMKASFRVQATGTSLTYKWEKSVNNGAVWSTIPNAILALYEFSTVQSDSGSLFRCVVTGACGTATSPSVRLTVSQRVFPADVIAKLGDPVSFTVSIAGTARQWQKSINGGLTFGDIPGATQTTYTFVAPDSARAGGWRFRCVTSNNAGTFDTSRVARLTVYILPAITRHPANIIGAVDSTIARFSVTATGDSLVYQWQRRTGTTGSWVVITGATDSAYQFLARVTDDNAQFRCLVSNRWNLGTQTSSVASLSVCVPAKILQATRDTGVLAGSTVNFVVNAKGMDLHYLWQKKGFGETEWSSLTWALDTSEYQVLTAKMGDSGSAYRCIVTGTCAAVTTADTSLAARLHVYVKPTAYLTMEDSTGEAPFTARFFDSSGGSISQRRWDFGDGSGEVDPASGLQVIHLYQNPGLYTVKLAVKGPMGNDSVTRLIRVYNPNDGSNKLAISGRRIAKDSVELVLSNFDRYYEGLPNPPPWVDTIIIWNRRGLLPDANALDNVVKGRYTLAQIKASPKVKMNVTATVLKDTIQGFMTQIVWKDKKRTAFSPENGCLVYMLDTAKQSNSVVVSGIYNPPDTVMVFLSSVNTIDTATVDSVGVWYGFEPDSVFRSGVGMKWWSSGTVVRGSASNTFTYAISDDRFNTDTKPLFCSVVLLGKNGVRSIPVTTSFSIGRPRPENQIKALSAMAVSSAQINLSWAPVPSNASVEKIRIVYSQAAIPFNYAFATDSIIMAGSKDSTASAFLLTENTKYFFGAQTFSAGMWSRVTAASSASDSTPSIAGSSIHNTITNVKCTFDSSSNGLRVSWSVDTTVGQNLEVGISYAVCNGVPVDTVMIKAVNSLLDSALVIMNPIRFDTCYTVQLWLRKNNEEWAHPTSQSRLDSVRTLPFTWQSVKYRFTEMGDTTKWVNGTVCLVTPKVGPTYVSPYTSATITSFSANAAASAGFALAGTVFRFAVPPSQPIEVSLRIDSLLLPAGKRPADARLYQYNPTLNRWVVRTSAKYDSSGKYLSLLTDTLGYAFAVMVDIVPPKVVLIGGSDEPVQVNAAISNRVAVSDNVGNLAWRVLTAKGGEPFINDNIRRGISTKAVDTLDVPVDSRLVSDLNGVRILVQADDGSSVTTYDLSRRVIRERSDAILTPVLKWTPLRVTAELDTLSMTGLFRFIDTAASKKNYDKRYLRLYRWHSDKWTEYGPGFDSVFSSIPGRLFWVKTRTATSLHFGRGRTLSLKDSVRIVARSGQWTDFALPYRFDMTVGDILDATRNVSGSKYADSLMIYQWMRNDTTETYRCEPFFLADSLFLPGYASRSKILYHSDAYSGYTVYNPSSSDIPMVFPPVSDLMSTYSSSGKISSGRGWVVKVLPYTATGARLSPVYCGSTAGVSGTASFYPMAPSFDEVRVGVSDSRSGKIWGHVMEHGGSAGSSYLLTFRNDGDSAQEIRYHLSPSGLDSQTKMAILDPATGEIIKVTSSGTMTVSVEAGGSEYRWLLVGEGEYLSSSTRRMAIGRLGLDGVYPNPVRSCATIRYTLPFGRVSRVEFLVIDIAGRTVSSAVVRDRVTSGGSREYQWKGRNSRGKLIASGVYIVKMSVYDLKGRVIGSFDRRLTVLP